MRNVAATALAGAAMLMISACSDSDDRSLEAEPESVEMPAQEALEPITDEPAADPEASGPAPEVDPETAEAAANVAEEAAAAAEASE